MSRVNISKLKLSALLLVLSNQTPKQTIATISVIKQIDLPTGIEHVYSLSIRETTGAFMATSMIWAVSLTLKAHGKMWGGITWSSLFSSINDDPTQRELGVHHHGYSHRVRAEPHVNPFVHLAILKKIVIPESLWLAANATRPVYFFISSVKFEDVLLMHSIH